MNTTMHHTGIPGDLYETLDCAAEALHVLCLDLRFSPMERDYLADTRNRMNMILLSPRLESVIKETEKLSASDPRIGWLEYETSPGFIGSALVTPQKEHP